jgi:hypothetical protein
VFAGVALADGGRAQQDGHPGEGDLPDPTDARDPGDHVGPEAHDPRALADVAGFQVVLVSLRLNMPAYGSGKTALITAGGCNAHNFTVKSHLVYTDGSTADLQSTSPCS